MKIPIKSYYRLLSKYLKKQWYKVIILGFVLISGIGLQLINPQIVRFFIDGALAKKPSKTLIEAAVLFIIIAFVQQLFAVLTTYLGNSIGWTSTNALRNDLVFHCLHLDMSFHKSFKPGELIERIDGDVTILLNFFSKLIIIVINNILLILGVLVLLFMEDWRIGLAQTIFVMIAVYAFLSIQSIAVPHWKAVRQLSSKFYGFIGEHISSAEDIKSSGATSYTMNTFYRFLQKWLPLQRKATVMGYSGYLVSLGLTALSSSIAFGLGAYLWGKGIITIGTIYLFYNYSSYLTAPVDQIRRQLQDLQNATASISRVEELLSRKSKLEDGTDELVENNSFDIFVNNVNFEYEENVLVLKDISFKLPKGKILGVLGRTGSGKTTLARLLIRLYDPKNGEIYFGNQPLKSIQLKSLREKVAYVTQDVQLFHATVRDNITFYNRNIKDETILKLIEEVGLSDWYKSLKNGLDTILEGSSGGLSAGEAQLLAFVRVFLKDPSLVILDEASSRLDPVTEKLVQNAMIRLLKGRTGIIIAHRLWTVHCADELMILDQGKILEYSTRETLEKDCNSRYYELLKTGMEEMLA